MRLLSLRLFIQTISGILGLIMGVLSARWLGPDARGALTLVLLVPYVGSVLLTLGMNDGAAYVVHRLGVSLRDLRTVFYLHTILVGGVAAFLVGGFVLLAGPGLWHYTFHLPLAAIISGLLLCRLWGLLGRGLLLADERYHVTIWLDVAESVIPLLLFLLFSVIYAPTLLGAALAYLISAMLMALWMLARLMPYAAPFPGVAHVLTVFRTGSAYGVQTLLRVIGGLLLQRADFFIVGMMLGIKELGIYSIANTIAESVVRIPDAASWLLGPRVSRESESQAIRTTNRFLFVVAPLTAITAFGVVLCAPPFVSYFIGSRFEGVTPVVSVLLIGVTISTVYKVLGASLIARGVAIHFAIATWIGAVVMLGLDLILLPRMGLIGAGVAASIGYTVNAAWVARAYFRLPPTSEARAAV